MEEKQVEKKDLWQRRNFWLTLIGIIASIVVSIVLYKNQFKVEADESKSTYVVPESKQHENTQIRKGSVSVKDVYISPVNLSIPSYFFIEFTSKSVVRPKDFKIFFDFGRASVKECGVSPANQTKWIEENEQSLRILSVSTIENSQSIYVSCFISTSDFPKVLIVGDNLIYETNFDLEKYQQTISKSSDSGFLEQALMFIIGALLFLILVRFLIRILLSI